MSAYDSTFLEITFKSFGFSHYVYELPEDMIQLDMICINNKQQIRHKEH
ncbi:hypothetical protein CVS40_5243 [Lucilia cuprina]|nr:hypothetical protein CVS40_5243 [Lucilia cuprina]